MTFQERAKIIQRNLSVLIEPGSIAELRVPGSDGGSLCGLFSDFKALAIAAAKFSGKTPGVFFSLNPVKRSMTEEVTNRLAKASLAVRDNDIACRRWFPIDIDPVRPSNTPSTEAEHMAAIDVARQCRDWLRELGWSDPILTDSGNGAHLLYRIDLPNDRPSRELVKRILQTISLRFSSGSVLVDTGNFNASRMWRVYGTLNCKGQATDERPHRRAKLLEVPDDIEVVNRNRLDELVSALPVSSKDSRKDQLDVARWVAEHKVPVLADAPWNSGGHKWTLPCPWNDSHNNNSAYIVRFPDGGIAAGCLHKSCTGRNWPALRAHFEHRNKKALPLGQKSKRADLLSELDGKIELFCTPQGDPYATVPVKDHIETHKVRSRAFELFLRHTYFSVNKTAPPTQALHEAVAHFSAVAMFDSPRKPVAIRVASAGDLNYLDLADSRWQSVEFDSDGWRVVETPTVRFRRSSGMLPLPIPVRGGDINELKRFLNLRTKDDWTLFITVMLAGVFSRGPYPVAGFHGEAGSAKTTAGKVFRDMLDPNSSPARAMPKDIHDLMVTASNNRVLVFDNLSYLPVWFSDCLCRFSTGGGFSTRQLYTDEDEIIFEGQRPVVLNGVEELASRTDLLDRSILFDLPVIENYREERRFWHQFEKARPRLLGALLDLAVQALRRLPAVHLERTPRLADFAVLATAAEGALEMAPGAFMKAYTVNREKANAVALEASPIASFISKLLRRQSWEGTAEGLLRKLQEMAPDEVQQRRSWPKNPKVLSGMLRRLATSLRRLGIEVELWRDNDRLRTRMISIKRRGSNAQAQASGRT